MKKIIFAAILFLTVIHNLPLGLAEPQEENDPGSLNSTEETTTSLPPKPSWLSHYLSGVAKKLDLGAANFLVGWTAIVSKPVELSKKSSNGNWLVPASQGFAVGTLKASIDTAGGILNLATFPIPQIFPLPEKGVDLDF